MARLSAVPWTTAVPLGAVVVLALTWGRDLGWAPVVVVGAILAAAVLSAVHHAEVVAHRVGEPFGSLVLAVAVTVIEVALIVTLMVSGDSEEDGHARARHGLRGGDDHPQRDHRGVGARRRRCGATSPSSTPRGPGSALAAVATLATVCLVLPDLHDQRARSRVLDRPARVRGRRVDRPCTACSSSSRPCATGTTSCPWARPAARTSTRRRRPTVRRSRASRCWSWRSWPSWGWRRRSRRRSRTAWRRRASRRRPSA